MSKALVLGALALALSAGVASAQAPAWPVYPSGLRLRSRAALRLRGSRIRLRRLWGTGHGRSDRYYRDARRSRLRSATGSVRVRTRILGRRVRARILGRLRELVKKRSDSLAQLARITS
jgi:hypothetical protein